MSARLGKGPPAPAPQQQPTVAPIDNGRGLTLSTSVSKSAEVLPTHPPNAPFFLAFDTNSLMVFAGKVIPRAIQIDLTPGVNNVSRVGEHGIDISAAEADQKRRGRIVVMPRGDDPLLNYLRVHQVRQGQYHCIHTSRPVPGTNRHSNDEAAFAAWVESLIAAGHVPAPTEAGLGILLEMLSEQHNQALQAQRTNPARVEQLRKNIELVEAAIEGMKGDAANGEAVTLGQ